MCCVSSDTESAAGGGARERQGRLAALGARVRGVLPKARDKVQATEAHGAEGDEKVSLNVSSTFSFSHQNHTQL